MIYSLYTRVTNFLYYMLVSKQPAYASFIDCEDDE